MQIENFSNQVKVDIEPLKKYEEIVITTDTDAAYVAERIGEIKKHIKAVEDQRLSYTKPLDEAKKKLIEDERKITDPLNSIIKTLNTKMVAWTLAQEKRRREEAEKKRQEELAALEAEKQRQLAIAATTDNEEAAKAVEEIEKNASRLEAAPVTITNTVKTEKGAWTIQTRWSFEVTNEKQVPREFLCIDEKKLQKYATAMKEDANVNGVRFYSIQSGASRG